MYICNGDRKGVCIGVGVGVGGDGGGGVYSLVEEG